MTAATPSDTAALDDLAFVIPVRVDSPDRLWNLQTVLRFIEHWLPGAEVLVVEQDESSKVAEALRRHPQVKHLLRNDGGAFRKAECVNHGVSSTTRRFVCMYDTDVLLAPEAIRAAVSALAGGGWRMVLPFNRIFLDVKGALRARLGQTLDIAGIARVRRLRDVAGQPEMSARFVEGGIFIADRETFLAEGGLNRKMVSYGWEDTEMHKRFLKLGYPILHLTGFNLVHLDHARGADSRPNQHYDANRQEYFKVLAMSPRELARYVETDLSLTALGQPQRLAALRQEHDRRGHKALRRLKAFTALVAIHVQAQGVWPLAARLLRR